jgi:PAS domain S-box-containing protein
MIPCSKEFELLAEAMPQLVWTKNPEGGREYLNKKWEEYTGISLYSSNWDWTDVIHPEDYDITVDKWDESLNNGTIFQVECRLRRYDGFYEWHLIRSVPVRDDDGNILIWIGTCTQIQDYKLNEEELKYKNQKLVSVNNDLDNFVYTASHDLKAPISNLEGLVSALKDDLYDKIEKEDKDLLEMINISISKLKNTITELTEIGKMQKELEILTDEVFFKKILEEIKIDLADMIASSHAEISSDFKIDKILFSRKGLRSILYNLLSNSIKYKKLDVIPKIHIETNDGDEFTLLSVTDNGLGIEETQKEKAFGMFRRLHSHVEGTGVGLYIVKQIVNNAGGKIEIESKVGVGTTFKIYFKK